jgi:hypothetical protein
LASKAARQKYPEPEGQRAPVIVSLAYIVQREQAAYDAGRVDELREAAEKRRSRGFLPGGVSMELRADADRIEKEARG